MKLPNQVTRMTGIFPSARSSQQLLIASILLYGAVIAFHAERTYTHLRMPNSQGDDNWGMMDFQDTVYYPVRAFIEGVNPYDTVSYRKVYPASQLFPLYSPLTLLVHSPYYLVPFHGAMAIHFGVSALCILVIAYLAVKFSLKTTERWLVFVVASLICMLRPGHLALAGGQIVGEMVIASLIAIHCSRSSPLLSGLALALSTLKPTFGIPLIALLACRRDFQAVGIGLCVAAAGSFIAVLILAIHAGGIVELLSIIPENMKNFESHSSARLQTTEMRIDLQMFISRFFQREFSSTEQVLIFIGMIGTSGVVLNRMDRNEGSSEMDSPGGLLIALTVLLCVYHSVYDSLILFPALFALYFPSSPSWKCKSTILRLTILAGVTIPFVNIFMLRSVRLAFSLTNSMVEFGITLNSAGIVLAYVATVSYCVREIFGRRLIR